MNNNIFGTALVARDIIWDTDGEIVDLPAEVEIDPKIPEEDIADHLSDNFGFCVKGFRIGKNIDIGCFTVDVTAKDNGKYDIWIAHDGNSGLHYTDVTADQIGDHVADMIECIGEAVQNDF